MPCRLLRCTLAAMNMTRCHAHPLRCAPAAMHSCCDAHDPLRCAPAAMCTWCAAHEPLDMHSRLVRVGFLHGQAHVALHHVQPAGSVVLWIQQSSQLLLRLLPCTRPPLPAACWSCWACRRSVLLSPQSAHLLPTLSPSLLQHAGTARAAGDPFCSARTSAHLLPTIRPSLLQHAGAARAAGVGGRTRG